VSTGTAPTISCDDESGCATWTVDYYAMTVDSINGVKVTPTPFGWEMTADGDHLCPEHVTESNR
jgi:hypothetical protein